MRKETGRRKRGRGGQEEEEADGSQPTAPPACARTHAHMRTRADTGTILAGVGVSGEPTRFSEPCDPAGPTRREMWARQSEPSRDSGHDHRSPCRVQLESSVENSTKDGL